jgi:hypothetical protein
MHTTVIAMSHGRAGPPELGRFATAVRTLLDAGEAGPGERNRVDASSILVFALVAAAGPRGTAGVDVWKSSGLSNTATYRALKSLGDGERSKARLNLVTAAPVGDDGRILSYRLTPRGERIANRMAVILGGAAFP